MKHFINIIADPIFSFPIFAMFFFAMIKWYRIVGTKKFLAIALAIVLPIIAWFLADPNFIKIILTPDNIPISILLVSITFLTWYPLYKAAQNDERIEAGLEPIEATPENREKVWAWPNLVYTELFVIIAGTIFLIVWAIYFKAPLEESANPTWAPNPAKAPWYFLGLQEMLVYFDPWMAGVVLPGIIIVGLIGIPYLDTNPKGNGYYCFKERKFAITSFLFGWLALWLYLITVGTFLRGPNWTFYGPFEVWNFHKVIADYNVNLSQFLWLKWLHVSMPKNLFVREILGIVVTFGYLIGLPLLSLKTKFGKGLLERTGTIRYFVVIFLLTAMCSLPIKMVLRWLFSLKYIIAMPEIGLNL